MDDGRGKTLKEWAFGERGEKWHERGKDRVNSKKYCVLTYLFMNYNSQPRFTLHDRVWHAHFPAQSG